MSFGYEILIIGLMLFINAVFASYEMALASISRARLSTLCKQKKRGSEEAAYMKDRMEASLAVVQLGITLAAAIAAATGGAGAKDLLEPFFFRIGVTGFYAEILALVCIVLPLSAFTIVFAELVPKMFALSNRESVCLILSPIMKAIAWMADPVVSFFEAIVKKIMILSDRKVNKQLSDPIARQTLYELKAAAALARTDRLIGFHEEKIVLSAVQLSQRMVTDIMLDADSISMIPVTDSLSEALIKAHLDMHTRFPVCQKAGDSQTIIGYLNFKDIVNALKMSPKSPSVNSITRPIKRLSATTSLSQALSEMMRERAHIALVISQDKTIVRGMITLEDIIEELVGKIEDEFDRLPAYVLPSGNGWIVGGAVSMEVVTSTLGTKLDLDKESGKKPILAEWVVQKLGREIQAGEVLSFDDISLIVRKIKRRKLAEAFISVISKQ